jgi:enoyl-CoA hydratase
MDNVKFEVEGTIGVLTLNRPTALNALNSALIAEIGQVIESLPKNVRALILTGSGEKAFAAGADIAEMANFMPAQALAFSEAGHRVFSRLESLEIPTIAAVNGFALGGGLELVLACDLIYVSEKARLGFPEVSLAVIPGFGGTQRLTRLVGKSRAKELILTAATIDAPTAKAYGMVLDVLPADKLMSHCKEVAAKIAQRGPIAVNVAKRVIEQGADLSLLAANALEAQAFGLVFGTEDQKEGMKAFLEKRPPAFHGK